MNRGDGDLIVSGTVGTQLEKWPGSTRVQDIDGGVPAVPVVIRLTAHTPLNTVRVNIAVEKPLTVTQDTFVLRTICETLRCVVASFPYLVVFIIMYIYLFIYLCRCTLYIDF